jgi:hypothetical protein
MRDRSVAVCRTKDDVQRLAIGVARFSRRVKKRLIRHSHLLESPHHFKPDALRMSVVKAAEGIG